MPVRSGISMPPWRHETSFYQDQQDQCPMIARPARICGRGHSTGQRQDKRRQYALLRVGNAVHLNRVHRVPVEGTFPRAKVNPGSAGRRPASPGSRAWRRGMRAGRPRSRRGPTPRLCSFASAGRRTSGYPLPWTKSQAIGKRALERALGARAAGPHPRAANAEVGGSQFERAAKPWEIRNCRRSAD